jgi:hypothetical protein
VPEDKMIEYIGHLMKKERNVYEVVADWGVGKNYVIRFGYVEDYI